MKPATANPSRRRFLQATGALVLAPGAVRQVHAQADPSRIALVIGNDAYPAARLANAVNDAKAMATLLRDGGFGIDLQLDANRRGLVEATRAFAERARRPETKLVFFYYAGHGAQLEWRNYLLPVDARIDSAADLPAQCLDLGVLLGDLSKAKEKTFVIVLDACRDNPFGSAFRPAQKGLSQFDAPPGCLLAFSTAPGSVAADGVGGNGLYTGHLVRELAVRDARIEDALKRVRLAVRLASKGKQVPWESTSLEADVLLFPAQRKATEQELEAQLEHEMAAWNRVKESQDTEAWIAYLRTYPSGRFSEIAQNRLGRMLARDEARTAPVLPPSVSGPPSTAASLPSISPPVALAASAPAAPAPAAGYAPPQLMLNRGPNAPVLMRPSANPSSAGTYPINRQFTVGDEATYDRVESLVGGKATDTRNVRMRVTRVDENADIVEFNRGRRITDGMGNVLSNNDQTFEPRQQSIPAEYQIGKKWKTRFRATTPDHSNDFEAYLDFTVASRENVTVPAGQFDAFRLEGAGYVTDGTRVTWRVWVVPNFNFFLRYEIERQARKGIWRTLESYALTSCVQHRWSVA